MSACNRKSFFGQFEWSLTTIFNPRTWYFNPRTPNPRTFLANPRTEKFFALRAAHFVLGLIKFYGTPLGGGVSQVTLFTAFHTREYDLYTKESATFTFKLLWSKYHMTGCILLYIILRIEHRSVNLGWNWSLISSTLYHVGMIRWCFTHNRPQYLMQWCSLFMMSRSHNILYDKYY